MSTVTGASREERQLAFECVINGTAGFSLLCEDRIQVSSCALSYKSERVHSLVLSGVHCQDINNAHFRHKWLSAFSVGSCLLIRMCVCVCACLHVRITR